MAICFVRAKVISRGGGGNAAAAAAYRSGEKIKDEATEKTHDYTKKQGVDHSEILSPIAATAGNEWLTNRSTLWNRVEASEKRYDAQLAREMIIAIPRELAQLDQIGLVREYVQTTFVDRGMIADINLHHLDGTNPHAHVMLTMRELKIDERGIVSFGNKDRTWNDKKLLETQIKEWEILANRYLERAEQNIRIDSRSYEEQGINRIPQIHLGKNVTAMRKKGIPTERGDLYDQIDKANEDIRQNLEKIYQTESEIERHKVWRREWKQREDEGNPVLMLERLRAGLAADGQPLEKITTPVETKPVVARESAPAAKIKDPIEYRERLKKEAAKQREKARLLHAKQIADLAAVPKRNIFDWSGLSGIEFAARQAAIKQEYQERLAEIERILTANLPIPDLIQEINDRAEAEIQIQQAIKEYVEREVEEIQPEILEEIESEVEEIQPEILEEIESEVERSKREQIKPTQAKPKPSRKKDRGR